MKDIRVLLVDDEEEFLKTLAERIKIREIPKRYIAALGFSGRWIISNFRKKVMQLLVELENKIEILLIK